MPLQTLAREMFADAIIGGAGFTKFGTATYLGVGDSSTAHSPSQTDLQAMTNKLRKQVDSGYPTRSGNVITWAATFGTNEANFQWNEAGVFNAASGGQMLCRRVQALGTKTSGTIWILTYQLTLTVS
jgi:hypothetical protein